MKIVGNDTYPILPWKIGQEGVGSIWSNTSDIRAVVEVIAVRIDKFGGHNVKLSGVDHLRAWDVYHPHRRMIEPPTLIGHGQIPGSLPYSPFCVPNGYGDLEKALELGSNLNQAGLGINEGFLPGAELIAGQAIDCRGIGKLIIIFVKHLDLIGERFSYMCHESAIPEEAEIMQI